MVIKITGGSGFVGSHIAKYLSDVKYDIDFITKSEFLNQEWSVLDGVDVVIHSAWCMDKDLQSIEHLEFAEWTCNFFNECKKRGIRVINIGSSSEYGVKYESMKEDMMCEPVSAYGIAKLSITLYAKLLGYNTLRIFTPFGKGGKNFKSMYKEYAKYSNPKNKRDYFPVELVAYAVERLINAPHIYGEIINVCSGWQESNMETVSGFDRLNAYEGSEKWFGVKNNQYEPSMWVGSPDKMKKLLNL